MPPSSEFALHPPIPLRSFCCANAGEPILKILLWKKDCLVFENTAPVTVFLSLIFIGSGLATAVSGHQEQEVLALCVGTSFTLAGLFLFYVGAQTIRVKFDVPLNQAVIEYTSLTGRKTTYDHPLSSLKGAFVTEGSEDTRGLELSFRSNGSQDETVPITQTMSSWGDHDHDAKFINTWLANHAPVDSTPPQA